MPPPAVGTPGGGGGGAGSGRRESRVGKDAHYVQMNTGGSFTSGGGAGSTGTPRTTPPGSLAQRRYSVSHAMAAAAAGIGGAGGAGGVGTGGTGGTGGTNSSSRSGGEGRDSLPRSQQAILEEVHPVTLRFRDADLEVAFGLFHRLQFETTWRRVWLAPVLVAILLQIRTILFCVYVSNDVQPVLDSIAVVLVSVLVPYMAALALALSRPLLDRLGASWQLLTAFLVALSLATGTVAIAYLSDNDPGFSAATYLLMLFVWTAANRSLFLYTVLAALPTPIAYGIYFGLIGPAAYTSTIGIIYVCISYAVFAIVVRDMELTMRHQFTHSSFLLNSNAKLRDQLNHLKVTELTKRTGEKGTRMTRTRMRRMNGAGVRKQGAGG